MDSKTSLQRAGQFVEKGKDFATRSKPVLEELELVVEVFGVDEIARRHPVTTVAFPLTSDLRDGASHELRPAAAADGAPGVALRLLWRQADGKHAPLLAPFAAIKLIPPSMQNLDLSSCLWQSYRLPTSILNRSSCHTAESDM